MYNNQLSGEQNKITLLFSVCQFPWCTLHQCLQTTKKLSPEVGRDVHNKLLQVGSSQLQTPWSVAWECSGSGNEEQGDTDCSSQPSGSRPMWDQKRFLLSRVVWDEEALGAEWKTLFYKRNSWRKHLENSWRTWEILLMIESEFQRAQQRVWR